jgi:sporulation protein YlmC with PRC-barrel domain
MKFQRFNALKMSMLAGGIALSLSAHAAEGLYSADDLMDADVYGSSGEEVGEIEDVLLDDGMQVHSLIMETDTLLGLGGSKLVLERGQFTVKPDKDSDNKWNDVEYEVHVDATQDEIKQFDEYNKGWWNETKESMTQAWENTQEGAASAWENTKEATSSAWHNTKEAVENMGDEAEEKTDNM